MLGLEFDKRKEVGMNEFLSNLAVALVSVLTAKALDIAYDKAKEKASNKPRQHK